MGTYNVNWSIKEVKTSTKSIIGGASHGRSSFQGLPSMGVKLSQVHDEQSMHNTCNECS